MNTIKSSSNNSIQDDIQQGIQIGIQSGMLADKKLATTTPSEGRIEISNNSEDEMKDKAKSMFKNFKNKEVIDQIKADFKFKGNGNVIYDLQEKMKRENPEKLKSSLDFIEATTKHLNTIRDQNINNFKTTNTYKPTTYTHTSLAAKYAKDPALHKKVHKEKLQSFLATYNKYIKESLPMGIPTTGDKEFC